MKGLSPLINRLIIRIRNRATSFFSRSSVAVIERTLILPKKIRLNVQSVYTAPSTLLVAANSVAQKF